MAEQNVQNLKDLKMRAKLPRYFRIGAVILLALTLLGILLSFYFLRGEPEFRMKGFPTELSENVVAEVAGYERREMKDNVVQYYIKADRATTFSDQHQELENVYLELFEPDGTSNSIAAVKAVYVPEEDKNFTAYFAGDVKVTTRDQLNVRTEQLTYKRAANTASAEEEVEFDRLNMKGTSFGAVVHAGERRVELLRDVVIETTDSTRAVDELAGSDVSNSKVTGNHAVYLQETETIEISGSVTALINSRERGQTVNVKAARAVAYLDASPEGKRALNKIELFDGVNVNIHDNQGEPTDISSEYAMYDRVADRFELRGNARIVTGSNDAPTTITAQHSVYEQSAGKVVLIGNAEVSQNSDVVKGDSINAELYPSNRLRTATALGNAFFRRNTPDRSTEITAHQLNATFNADQVLTAANTVGQSTVTMTPANVIDYTKVKMTAPRAITLSMKGPGLLDKLTTDGRTTIRLDAPNNAPDASDKIVTADTVNSMFGADGRALTKVEAVGNAELEIIPLRALAQNYNTKVNAPRFDCDFFPGGNNARSCIGGMKTRTVRTPTVKAEGRGTQTLLSDKLTATFGEQTKDLEKLDAVGNAKFTELDRNAVADTIAFTANDDMVRLRGGEPTAWDNSFRVKAPEIDWDTNGRRSHFRNGVSTTYYSQKQTGGSMPFSNTGKPVFLTANSAEVDHDTQVAVYTGNARGWQENNYVRGEQFVIDQAKGTFRADNTVQSLLYDAKRTINGKETSVPVYASADQLAYNQNERVLRYRGSVDIRQGDDRITSNSANVFLDARNEVTRTDAEGNVVVTQPKRRATGKYARYDAVLEQIILRGDPATVNDAEQGSTQGGELVVFLKEDRVIAEGRSTNNAAGRTRSVYKVQEK